MEDDLNILVNGRRPPKLKKKKTMQPKENKKDILYVVLKNSTVTSGNLTNTTTKTILGHLKKQNPNQP